MVRKSSGIKCNLFHLCCCKFIILFFIIFLYFRTNSNYKSFEYMTDNSSKSFILFHWDQCGHCKDMMPEWDKFTSLYNNKFNPPPIRILKFEKSSIPSKYKHLPINSFPSILLLDHNDQLITTFDRNRTSHDLLLFLS